MTDHIVHVGVWKTGSTWLQEVVFPSVQGATFASGPIFKALLRNLKKDDVFYESTFRTAISETTSSRLLLSDEYLAASRAWVPVTYDADRSADRLARIVPGARVVLFTRDPDTLAGSLYAQYVKQGGYVSQKRFEKSLLNRDSLDMNRAIKRYRSRFDSVLVLPYEQLRSEPRECIRRIEEFCDVTFEFTAEKSSANVSLYGWRLSLVRRWNRVCRVSKYNPNPLLPIPGAGALPVLLQKRLRL